MRDDDVRAPSGATPEVRAEGLWSALECETPGLHWTVGLEAFAVALDDPLDAWGAERGDRVGLGFDLEWETAGDALPIGAGDQSGGERWFPCVVSGEVLVGAGERITVDAAGWRSRRWGLRRPLTPWIAGRFDDGRWLAPRADDLAATVRHAAPLLEDGARARYDLCEVRGPGGQGRAWRLTIP